MTHGCDWFVGVDWGSEEHAICLVDATGQVRGERRVAHTAAAVDDAIAWLRQQTDVPPAAIAIAIETPRGVRVDTLLDQGFAVFAINPKQLDRLRDRFTVAGAKDDRRDAQVLADGLRTTARAFRAVRPEDPAILQLRELCRIDEELHEQERRLTNRLREQLFRIDAPWLAVNPAADDPWLWALLRDPPDPTDWGRLTRRPRVALLREHRIRRLTAETLLTAVQQRRLTGAPGVAEAVGLHIASLVPQLLLVHAQRTTTQRHLDRALDRLAATDAPDEEPRTHRDVEILRSLPGVGRMVTATMLTDAAAARGERDYHMLRTQAGTAPVTKRSGKRVYTVRMRYACKPRLRNALYYWALASLPLDATTRGYDDARRQRGHTHARALRSVADRWLRILIAMLRSRRLYDPAQPRPPQPAAA